MSRPEISMLLVLLTTLVLWVLGPRIGVSAGTAAMMGLSTLMFSGVLTWEQCLQNKGAWDTLMWFAILTSMAGQLNAHGVIAHFSSAIGGALASLSLGWPVVWAVLCLTYFLMHYVFASQTGHVAALYRRVTGPCPPSLGFPFPPLLPQLLPLLVPCSNLSLYRDSKDEGDSTHPYIRHTQLWIQNSHGTTQRSHLLPLPIL